MQVRIKREWLDACGYRHIARQDYDVIETLPQRLPDNTRMFVVSFNGRPWHVAEWRCETVTQS